MVLLNFDKTDHWVYTIDRICIFDNYVYSCFSNMVNILIHTIFIKLEYEKGIKVIPFHKFDKIM